MTRRPHSLCTGTVLALAIAAIAALLTGSPAESQRPPSLLERAEPMAAPDATRGADDDFCEDRRTVKARVVALDQHYFLNRSGASIPGGAIFALANDVVSSEDPKVSCYPNPIETCEAGKVQLRKNKRARPIVLRVNEGDCLEIEFSNMLAAAPGVMACSNDYNISCTKESEEKDCGDGNSCNPIQPSSRGASVHIQGVNWVDDAEDDGSFVGMNVDSLVEPGHSTTYRVYAVKEGPYFLYAAGDDWTAFPGDPSLLGAPSGDGGWLQEGLFGSLNVQPSGYEAAREFLMEEGMAPMQIWQAEYYRSQVTEQDLCMASKDGSGSPCTRGSGLPTLDYQAVYPAGHELAGFPILNMLCNEKAASAGTCDYNEIVHSDLTAIITGPGAGRFPDAHSVAEEPPSLRPVYSYPQRLQPYREFSIHYHETYQVRQSFAQFFQTFPALKAAQDNFGINYGFGGLAPSVLANRLGVGPGSECVDCKYEEFFLTSWVLGDPAMIVDHHAEDCLDSTGKPKEEDCRATLAKYPDDPSNVYHSYMSDHLKFRIHHAGPDLHHLHHQHAHQWLGSPNSPNADYLDSQSIGPGSSFTLEMVYEGSGNLNQTVGDSIFHCHFYPHFASGMWSLWRVHDTFEAGTKLDSAGRPVNECSNGAKPNYKSDMPCGEGATLITNTRALPDGEIVAGAPTPALVPMPTLPMAPVPADVRLTDNGRIVEVDVGGTWVSSHTSTTPVDQPWIAQSEYRNPGYPYFIPGFAGERAPHPPMDFAWAYENCSDDYSYLNGSACTPPQFIPANRKEMMVQVRKRPVPEESGCTCTDPLDGGLPRHLVLNGVCDPEDPSTEVGCGADYLLKTYLQLSGNNQTNFLPFAQTDFSKEIKNANAMQLPEGGTQVEKIAMAAHAQRFHYDSQLPDGTTCGTCSDNQAPCFGDTPQGRVQCGNPFSSTCESLGDAACGPGDGRINFVLNGLDPISGAPYADPCIQYDRTGGEAPGGIDRDYLAADIQLDAVFNKEGWHFPQQRILSLWGDAQDFIDKKKPPEPLFMRVNSYDCMNYTLANLVPNVYELDDFQVRTPTDVIGQHIHLVKFDVTSSDGAANGWNYEDGTFAPNEVTERIHAINANDGIIGLDGNRKKLDAKFIKFFGPGPGAEPDNPDSGAWLGSQATIQRWYDDPLYNNLGFCTTELSRNCTLSENRPQWGMDVSCPDQGLCDPTAGFCIDTGDRCTETNKSLCGNELSECVPLHDRTIRTVFTHDHYGPSTHQQAGLYAGVVAEPKDSKWLDNETGVAFGGYDATRCALPDPDEDCPEECIYDTEVVPPPARPAYCGVIPGRTAKANGVYLMDSGPTSWQAIIEPPILPGSCKIADGESSGYCQLHPNRGCSSDNDCSESYREFLLEFQDSALMYEPFYGPAFDPEVWTLPGNSQYANAASDFPNRPGVCNDHDGEPCGFCSYTGVCSGNSAIKCMVNPPGGSTVPDVCGNAGPCSFIYGALTACTPEDLSQCASNTVEKYIKNGLEDSESCNFIAGIPATSWAFGNPIDAQGTGVAEGVTFNAATNNFSVNYRNEPLYGRTTDPQTGAPLSGTAGDMAYAYQSIGRPNPRGRRCREANLQDCTTTGSCDAGVACQQAGFCSDNSALCVNGILTNCADPGTASCVISASAFPYPETPLTAGIGPWDPFTPLMRTYAGDDIQLRTLVGAHINPHNFTMHGLNWLKEPSYVNSGWRNSEIMGISEHFEIIMRTDPAFAGGEDSSDYLYQPGAAAIEQASGNWGILRSYNTKQDQLAPLLQNPPPATGSYPTVEVCPADAYERNYSVVALSAHQALGGPLVYNNDIALKDGAALLYFRADDPNVKQADGMTSCANDPASCATYTGSTPHPLVLRAAAGDCVNVTLYNNFNGLELSCTDSTESCDGKAYGEACGSGNCYYFGADGKGFCSNAPAFECTVATASNDCGGTNTCQPVIGAGQASLQVKTGGPFPSRVTQTSNTSPNVGLRPQLVTYDLNTSDGSNGGDNPVQTVAPGDNRTYTWYAGHIEAHPAAGAMQHIPIEFGGSNLLPSDPMNHYRHALFGGLVIEPPASTWSGPGGGFDGIEAVVSYQRTTGTDGEEVMSEPAQFREFVIFMQDDLQSVRSTLGPQVNAINYSSPFLSTAYVGTNPSARYCAEMDEYGDYVKDADGNFVIIEGDYDCVLSDTALCCTDKTQASTGNNKCGTNGDWYRQCGDPTPLVFEAYAGEEVRMRLLHPGGTNTANVFELYGHTWSEGPFETMPEWCDPPTTHTNLYAAQRQGDRNLCGSQEFWTSPAEMEAALMAEAREQFTRSEENNRQLMEQVEDSMRAFRALTTEGLWEQSLDEWRGSRMGHGPSNHFDVLIEEAGGRNKAPGDYLFRSFPSMHFNRGVWGIFRVKEPVTAEAGESEEAAEAVSAAGAER